MAQKSFLAAAFAFLLCACASYAPAPMPSVPVPRLDGSERWVYEQINPYNGLRVRTLTDTLEASGDGFLVVRRSDRPRDPVQTRYVVSPWRIGWESEGVTRYHYSPPLTIIPFPIAPGSSWFERVDATDARGESRQQQTWGRALGWERIETPAGEFVALRIERNRNLFDRDNTWDDTYIRETLWYAPAVKRWVRLEWHKRRQELGLEPRGESDDVVWQLESVR